jgi:hypothetical protein
LEDQAALRRQLESAAQRLRARQAEEAGRARELEVARGRLDAAVAEEAALQQRLDALRSQKVRCCGSLQAPLLEAHCLGIRQCEICNARKQLSTDHLIVLQAEAAQQLAGQVERRQRAAQRAARLAKQLQAAAGGAASKLPPGVSLAALVADMQLAQVKEGTTGMLEALRAVAAEHPHLSLLQRVESQAGVKLEATAGDSRPGSAAAPPRTQCSSASLRGSPCGSRPGSCAGRASLPATARGSPAPAAPVGKSPGVRTVELQL